MQKTALICGISGQDGAYLAEFLLNKGYEVYGTSRDAQITSFRNLDTLHIRSRVSFLSMAVTDFRSVLQVLEKVQPTEIYNLAGQSSVSLSFEQPVETLESFTLGTLNLLEAIRFSSMPVKYYNCASSECFGDTGEEGADESTPFHPKSPYAVAKATAFWIVDNYRDAYKLYACSGILFNHESPLRPEHFVTKKIIAAAYRIANGSREILKLGNIDIKRDWGWAPEYVESMYLMLQQEAPEDFVIASGSCYSLKEFVALSFKKFGLDWERHVDIDAGLLRPSEIEFGRGNPRKASEKLGWEARHGMPEIIEFMKRDLEFSQNSRKPYC